MRITSSITIISDMRAIPFALMMSLAVTAAQAQEWAKERLEKSPRRHEQVMVNGGAGAVEAFVAYPDAKGKKPAVILIHDSSGLTDWFKSLADDVAGMGYVVVAPNVKSQSDAIPELNAVADYAKKLPGSNGMLFVAGLGWGGAESWRFAAERPDVAAALVFCGASPDKDAIARIKGDVYGFYAANDPKVDATVPPAQAAAKAAGVVFEAVTYDGVGPGFMESGVAPDAKTADKLTRGYAMERMKSVLDMVSLRGY
jgi:carboxymethylenebutenolidase